MAISFVAFLLLPHVCQPHVCIAEKKEANEEIPTAPYRKNDNEIKTML